MRLDDPSTDPDPSSCIDDEMLRVLTDTIDRSRHDNARGHDALRLRVRSTRQKGNSGALPTPRLADS